MFAGKKRNFLTILVLIALFTSAVLFYESKKESYFMEMDKGVSVLRMGTNFLKSVENLDPANINSIEEYELVMHLFGRLIQYHNQKIVADLADKFYWDDENLVFEFGTKSRTSNGQIVTAEDAYYSLKRAIFLKRTGHGDLRDLICPGHIAESIEDACPGIKLKGDKLILTPFKKSLRSFLLPFLENADFSIIPKKNINFADERLAIKSYSDTTGPYFIKNDDAGGKWVLEANRNSEKYSPLMPQTIQLVASSYWNVFQQLQSSEIDYAPVFLALSWNEIARSVYADTKEFNVYKSMPVRIWLVCFTPKALSKSSLEQRMSAAAAIAKVQMEYANTPDSAGTIEFFQGMSDGNIDDNQKAIIIAQRNVPKTVEFTEPLKLAVPEARFEFFKDKLKDHPEIEVVNTKLSAYLLPLNERQDMYVIATDSAWTENISLLGHNISAGIFHLPGLNGEKWLSEFTQTEEKEERMRKLRDLHFELLKRGVIYPVSVSPYLAFAKKPWTMKFDPYGAGSPAWQMRREQ